MFRLAKPRKDVRVDDIRIMERESHGKQFCLFDMHVKMSVCVIGKCQD